MNMKSSHLKQAAALAVGLTCGASAVQAQGALVTQGTVIAHSVATGGTGDVVNGLGGEVYGGSNGMQTGLIDENGTVTFFAQMQGGTATNLANDKGIFRGTTRANVSMLIRGTDPAPGLPGLFLRNATSSSGMNSSLRVSATGQVLFQSNLQDAVSGVPATADTALLGGVVGSFGVFAREGDLAPGTVGATFGAMAASQQFTGLNRNGRVLFNTATVGGDTITAAAPMIANNLGLWTGPQGSLVLVQRKGDAPAGAPGTVITTLGFVFQMNSANQVTHDWTLSTVLGSTPATLFDDKILEVWTPSSGNAKVVREGDPAPGTVSATFNNQLFSTVTPLAMGNTWSPTVGASAFNASGQIGAWWELFNGDTVPPPTSTSTGYSNNAALYRASTSGMTMIFRKGDVAPGTGGASFRGVSTSSASMNNSGKFAVQGFLFDSLATPPPPASIPAVTTANDSGVWIGDEFGMTLIMREGDAPPSVTGGGTIDNLSGISPFHFNNSGQLLFQTNIIGNTNLPPVTRALYSYDPVLGLTLQLTDTDSIEVQTGVFKTAFTWGGIANNNGDADSLTLNDSGDFVLNLSYTPTAQTCIRGKINTATPRTAYCFGDGTDTACPCANTGLPGRGCDNTAASGGATITCTGLASIANDTLVLNGANAVPFGPGLYYQGSTRANPSAPFGIQFGNGLRCAGGSTPRLEIQPIADGTGASSTTVQIHILGSCVAGDVRNYQLWYRDSPNFGACTSGFNFSNAVTLTWVP